MQSIQLQRLPIYLYATVVASISIVVGLIWDISWHLSIGRDGLFSTPHLAIYFGGVVAGIFSGARVLKVTFAGTETEKNETVKFWGFFHGSIGALFCIWGAFAMLTSAPFDDWWHAAYGLDVQILSPPHTVLLLGMIMIQFGAIVSVLSRQNGGAEISLSTKNILNVLFALSSGFLLVMLFTMGSEYLRRQSMHGTLFYQVASGLFPLVLIAFSVSTRSKWGATQSAIVYTILMMLLVWILPLFPAEPLLGPVLNHITHFQAFEFPLMLIIPCIGIDLVTQKFSTKNGWIRSLIYAGVFLVLFLLVQWPFADLLMAPIARTWFFGRTSWYFGSDPDWEYRYAFPPWNLVTGFQLIKGLSIALVIGVLFSRIALLWGGWMKKVVR